MEANDACCGFGGSFCVKYPEISVQMAAEKAKSIDAAGADLVLGGDLACLMNIAGILKRQGSTAQVRHLAEVLAGMCEGPAIGEGES
jgi:L-lactate dehydrogenase complex protein LldE